jgi:VWFA-related protein
MTMRAILQVVASLVCGYLTLAALQPQQPLQERQSSFEASVDLVMLPVSVLGPDDFPIEGLSREDFVIFEDDVEQELAILLSPEEAGLDIALLMDVSDSMGNMEDAARGSALQFLNQLGNDDCVLLLRFTSTPGPGIWGHAEDQRIRRAIVETPAQGGSAVRDAIAAGFERLGHDSDRCRAEAAAKMREGGAAYRRPALIVVTDGIDQHSVLGFNDLLSIAKQADAPFLPVGFGDIALRPSLLRRARANAKFGGYARMRAAQNLSELEALARVTGGEFIRGGRSVERLNAAYEEVLRWLRSYYLVGYYPDSPGVAHRESKIPTWHEVEVRVRLPGYRVRTRTGYYDMPIDFASARRHVRAGKDLISRGQTGEALVELNLALQSNPRSWEAHYHRAHALFLHGEGQEAQLALLRAAELSPGRGDVHKLASKVSLDMDDIETAWEQAIRAHQAGIDMTRELRALRLHGDEPRHLEERLTAPRLFVDPGNAVDPPERAAMQHLSRALAQELSKRPEVGLTGVGALADYRIVLTMKELSEWSPRQLEVDLGVWKSASAEAERIYSRDVKIFDIEDRERTGADLAPHIFEFIERLSERPR